MASFLFLVSFLLKKFNNFSFSSFSSKDWWLIIFSGVFGALSWLFYFFALKNGPATSVAAIDRLSIVFVFILAIIFLGEGFSLKGMFGALLIIAGAILLSWK